MGVDSEGTEVTEGANSEARWPKRPSNENSPWPPWPLSSMAPCPPTAKRRRSAPITVSATVQYTCRSARGLINKQIAAQLGTAERTVKAHRARVMEKMVAQSVADLARAVERLNEIRE
jgi:DNA-binding CsgD family transcriptional regulator